MPKKSLARKVKEKEAELHLTRAKTLPEVPGSVPAPMPRQVQPMLATLYDKPFSDPEWLYEMKWDGIRALCFIDHGQARIVSRNNKEIGFRYPELANIGDSVLAEQAILDGEIVALDENGIPSFQLLQSRMGLQKKNEIARLAGHVPVVYYVFDLLYFNGFNLMPGALIHRKMLLKSLILENIILRYSEHVLEEGVKLFKEAGKMRLEGIIAKRHGSSYVQKRSRDWLKLKTVLRQEMVIAGYTRPRGSRQLFGALILGLYKDGQLQYVGHVGGGFNDQSLRQVYDLMQPLKTAAVPFPKKPKTNELVQWIKPSLVCEVKFSEWTDDERLRQPIFLGLRDDKEPTQCTIEKA